MANKNPGKRIKEICAELGEPYTVRRIDSENVIYRNLENCFDFEISGLDNQRRNFEADLYIWDTKNGSGPQARIVDKIFRISSLADLQSILDAKVVQYHSIVR